MMHLNLRVPTPSKKILIIAGLSSRPYVKSAVDAGFEVVAIDAFADSDTKSQANSVYKIGFRDGQLDASELLSVLDNLDLQQVLGFCYGAGFEAQPDLLEEIGERVHVLGNTADVIKQCKAPGLFFKRCDDLGVPHPQVVFERPLQAEGWLQKSIGGSGGEHVKRLSTEKGIEENIYYQQFQQGKPISCLFLSDGQEIQVIGFNEQWLDDSTSFRYGGAVSHVEISDLAVSRFTRYVKALSQTLGLVGLNSCDAICNGDDVWVLEINPRLSASMDLYSLKKSGLMAAHLAASQKVLNEIDVSKGSKAHQVIYAKEDVLLERVAHWPMWVSDVPNVEVNVVTGMPICTVLAEAETAPLAKTLVQSRVVEFNREFLT